MTREQGTRLTQEQVVREFWEMSQRHQRERAEYYRHIARVNAIMAGAYILFVGFVVLGLVKVLLVAAGE